MFAVQGQRLAQGKLAQLPLVIGQFGYIRRWLEAADRLLTAYDEKLSARALDSLQRLKQRLGCHSPIKWKVKPLKRCSNV